MRTQPTLLDAVTPVVNLVPDDKLKNAILQSFTDAPEAVKQIEACFRTLPIQRWSDVTMSTFFHSWKATHLKMLAIYGLSCRLQRQALQSEGAYRLKLLEASALNAETSHEDLGLDFDGKTHAELYDQLVMTYLGHDHWQLAEYGLPAALTFKSWIYRNMAYIFNRCAAVGTLLEMALTLRSGLAIQRAVNKGIYMAVLKILARHPITLSRYEPGGVQQIGRQPPPSRRHRDALAKSLATGVARGPIAT